MSETFNIAAYVCVNCQKRNPANCKIFAGPEARRCVVGHINGTEACRESRGGYTEISVPFHARDRFVGGSGPAGHHGTRSLWLVHEQSPGGNELHHNRHNDIYRRVSISIRYPTETSFHTISHYFILKRNSNHTVSYCFILFHKWTVISEISIFFHTISQTFHTVSYIISYYFTNFCRTSCTPSE